jgi:hypothetical protein
VEYGEWETDVRTEGSNYAIPSFSRKVGQGIRGGIAAFGIGVGGYVAGAVMQSPAPWTPSGTSLAWRRRSSSGSGPRSCWPTR